jgi:hypothetical protein
MTAPQPPGHQAPRTAASGSSGKRSQQPSSLPQRDSQPPCPTLVEQLDDLFVGLWPGKLRDLFDPEMPKPLAIGIHEQIADALGMDAAERKRLSRLLGKWTGCVGYLKAVRREGALRYGIDGEPVVPVSRDDAISARQRLYKTRLKLERRKAAQREPERREVAEVAQMCRANAAKPVLRLGAQS